MTADAAQKGVERRRRRWFERKRWRALVLLLILFAGAIAILWVQRRSIAADVIDREIARRGVPARYTVADIGFARQKLTNVVLGDPRDPDLVADWVIVRTRIGTGGAEVTGVDAGNVRVRARWRNGALSFGAIDRLLPPPSGKAFALPALDAGVANMRLRIELPQGVVGARLSGSGMLNDGFAGRLALASDTLSTGGCTAAGVRAAFALKIADAHADVRGPVRVADARCGDMRVADTRADLTLALGAALDRWTGRVDAVAGAVTMPGAAAGRVEARASFDGSARGTVGDGRVALLALRAPQGTAERVALDGRYRLAPAGAEFAGTAALARGRAADALVRQVTALAGGARGTPVGPLVDAATRAGAAALRDVSGDARIELVSQGAARAIRVTDLTLTAASGARASIDGDPIRFGALDIGGRIAIGGGGLPDATVSLARRGDGFAGRAVVRPYAASGARLALTPVDFAVTNGAVTRATTTATLSGPVAGGRIDGLRIPLDLRWRGTTLVANPGCTPVAWSGARISGLTLNPARLRICAAGAGLVVVGRGGPAVEGRVGETRLTGRIGGTPLDLAFASADLRLAGLSFALGDIRARLGAPERVTRINVGRLVGRAADGAVGGTFGDGGGQIANVPLILSGGDGDWSFAGGRLRLSGRLGVRDAERDRRFEPLVSEDVALTLVGNRIDATGTLIHPGKRVRVADVRIAHDLSAGVGTASLDVPRISFSESFQPNELTPLTFGVVAEVRGDILGRGRIDWSPAGVTSTGRFSTPGLDLAAAFGPVTGIRGELTFTDLLGLVSAPGQVATVATVNPGIAVENGTVRYRLTGDNRVQVEGGYWPFAGGRLTLDPTLLDFNANQLRRMTFRVDGADAATFLQQFDFDNLSATGTFDGVLPMTFDESGGRIVDGRLAARGGGSIAYVGTITEKDVGVWGNMAFQALRALNYRSLDITLNGPLSGEMVTAIRFAGVSQGEGTKSNFIIRRLARLPFVFNITIRAPFRQLLDSVRSYYDPSRLIERNLPTLIEQQRRREGPQPPPSPALRAPAIQPPESETRP